jgi:nickel transport protein
VAHPDLAGAHEVEHDVERGRAVAVRVHSDGDPLAYAEYEVYSPSDSSIPHQKGRTDRNGWLAFVPDAAGAWRVKVVDATGHGLDVAVDALAPAERGQPGSGQVSPGAFVLRPLLGIAAVAAVFAALYLLYRRKGSAP